MKAKIFVAMLVASSVAACGDDAKPPQTAASKTTPSAAGPTNRLPKDAPASATTSAVRISEEIAKTCGIKEPDAYFAFDSANLQTNDLSALNQVATCFVSGPMKSKVLKSVGHTDPRGNSEYNMTLGQSRADAVSAYVTGKGLEKSRAQSGTRGEMDAVGSDEPGWARDRRVDLMTGP